MLAMMGKKGAGFGLGYWRLSLHSSYHKGGLGIKRD
jgi:hypothetical protein